MIDIEVKRKELETAKRIRDNNYLCDVIPKTGCTSCPCRASDAGGCAHWASTQLDRFISTREAELAALEETPTNTASTACPVCQGKGTVEAKSDQCQGCWHNAVSTGTTKTHYLNDPETWPVEWHPSVKTAHSPTLDDFALALIQGGYFQISLGEDAAISNLLSRAEKIKAALDARRGA